MQTYPDYKTMIGGRSYVDDDDVWWAGRVLLIQKAVCVLLHACSFATAAFFLNNKSLNFHVDSFSKTTKKKQERKRLVPRVKQNSSSSILRVFPFFRVLVLTV